jgi:excinuclease ABC subunit A
MGRASLAHGPSPAERARERAPGAKHLNGHASRGREPDAIEVRGAREHNLEVPYLSIPKRSLVVFTGPSGSGKSSLAFDTLYAEGQRRYLETLPACARQFLGQLERPHVERIRGLSPTIAIEQKSAASNPRSTVGTITEVYDSARSSRGAAALRCRRSGARRRGRSRSSVPASTTCGTSTSRSRLASSCASRA